MSTFSDKVLPRILSRWRLDLLAVAVIGALILLFLGHALGVDRVLLPLDIVTQEWPPWQQPDQPVNVHNPLVSDVVNYIFPVKTFAADTVRQGKLPLWNPFVLNGYPFTYNTQAGLFYPLSALYYFLPAVTAVDSTILLQLFLGGLFMYAYLQQLQLRRQAALFGSILFLFNGMMVVWLQWQVVHAAVIWLPLQLYFVERMVTILPNMQSRGWLWMAVMAGIAFALPWLGGHWNWTLYVSMTTAVYLSARLFHMWRAEPSSPIIRRRVGGAFTAVFSIGIGLSLVQVLPALTYLAQSHRQDLPFAESLHFGLLNRAVVFLIPHFFGDPISKNWWGVDNFNETTAYLGILPLLLVAIAIYLRRDWITRFYALWGGIGLLWTLGTPVYGLLYVLPVFGGLLPSRAAVVVVFSGTVLAALGMDRLLNVVSTPRKWGKMAVFTTVALLAIAAVYLFYYRLDGAHHWAYLQPKISWFLFWLAGSMALLWGRWRGWLGKRPFAWLAILWLTADLFWFGYNYNPSQPVADLYPPTATSAFLQAETEPFRIVTTPTGVAYPPNSTLMERINNLSGYEPGILRRLVNYINLAEGSETIYFERKLMPQQAVDSPLLDALNVKYLVTTEEKWGDSVPVNDTPAVVSWGALPQERSLIMPAAGLQRVDIQLREGLADSVLIARILSADGVYEFANAEISTTNTDGDGTWISFFFTPFPSEWGRNFVLRVEGDANVGLDNDGAITTIPYYLTQPHLAYEAGKTRVYLRPTAFPRAYAVANAVVVADEKEALTAVSTHAAELDQWVVLEREGQALQSLENGRLTTATVQITEYGLNRVDIVAMLDAPAYVVLADNFYAGWQATIDGEKTPIYRANSVSRAVQVPAGTHTIQFTFLPLDFLFGAMVSLATLLLALFLLRWSRH